MKIKNVDLKEFLECLDIVSNSIPNKSTMPLLTNVYLKFENEHITFLGYDGNTSIKRIMFNNEENFEVLENGEILVECKMLKAILSKLNCQNLDLYTKDNLFIIKNGKNTYKLKTTNVEDYPIIKFIKLENEVNINTNELKNIINNTIFACATNENRPILTGVNFSFKENKLSTIATDSFRLSKYDINLEDNTNNVDFVFPKQSLLALEKIISKTNEETIKLLYDNEGQNILINFENTLYKTKLLYGKYPVMDRILDMSNCDKVCTINKNDLFETIDRISILSDCDKQTIKMEFKENNQVEISNIDGSYGNGSELIDCEKCDFNLIIVCNYKNLLEELKIFNQENINIYLSSEVRPFFIKEVGNENLLGLLLPVKQN